MATSATERFRQHTVWKQLEIKLAALDTARYASESIEQLREETVGALRQALVSKGNPVPFIYDDALDNLQGVLNSISSDESSFYQFARSYGDSLRQAVRNLPGPAPRQVNDRYLAALDEAITAREQTLADLELRVSEGTALLGSQAEKIKQLTALVDRQPEKLAQVETNLQEVSDTAAGEFASAWETELKSWKEARAKSDSDIDQEIADQLALLGVAAAVGRRLVEHAAGLLTATKWTERATRERRSANMLRVGAVVAFVGALVIGAYIVWHAIDKGFVLTVGDGILRGALVLALVGAGSFLNAEARRHFKEADSAEEVSLAMAAIEPFYAGAADEDRQKAREAVGDAVFVRNILSRYSSRDASKHAAVSNAQISEIVDMISKSADVAKKVSVADGS